MIAAYMNKGILGCSSYSLIDSFESMWKRNIRRNPKKVVFRVNSEDR